MRARKEASCLSASMLYPMTCVASNLSLSKVIVSASSTILLAKAFCASMLTCIFSCVCFASCEGRFSVGMETPSRFSTIGHCAFRAGAVDAFFIASALSAAGRSELFPIRSPSNPCSPVVNTQYVSPCTMTYRLNPIEKSSAAHSVFPFSVSRLRGEEASTSTRRAGSPIMSIEL